MLFAGSSNFVKRIVRKYVPKKTSEEPHHTQHLQLTRKQHSILLFYKTQTRSTSTTPPHLKYCIDRVRQVDHEHFYCSLFYPVQARRAIWAIRAFNIETAAIKHIISQVEPGKLRIEWWRVAIASTFKGTPPEHPVAKALASALQDVKLTKGWFLRMLDCRERDLGTLQPQTIQELEEYAENTSSSLLYLSLETLGIKNIQADHAASHLGKAIGLCILLRAVPFHSKAKQVYLPLELTMKHGVSQEQLFRGEHSTGLLEVVYELANLAKAHLSHSKQIPNLPQNANIALLSAAYVDSFLNKLQKNNFNVFDPQLLQKPLWPKFVIAKNFYLGKF